MNNDRQYPHYEILKLLDFRFVESYNIRYRVYRIVSRRWMLSQRSKHFCFFFENSPIRERYTFPVQKTITKRTEATSREISEKFSIYGNEIKQSFKTNMSSDSLKKLSLFFDEFKRIKVWEPETAQRTTDLRDESKDFVQKVTEFHKTSSDFLTAIQALAREVEKEKIKALGSSNALKSMAKQRECQQQQYQSLIIEKSAELERLKVQHQSLLKVQLEQQEMINQIQLY